jgi:glycerol-3-phosphate acyltransferase PlsX
MRRIKMIILLDAMGGDNAPEATIKGAVQAINEVANTTEVWLIGQEEVIKNKVKEFYGKTIEEISPRLKIYNATETIEMEDIPTHAIKRKKDSSMVVGFNLLKEGKGDVFISAGNSGALLTGATLIIGRIRGVDRPALAGILPSKHKRLVLMDCGSNTNCKPINLLQFAQMSSIYIRNTFGVENPRIGLLNIGTEETKGNELVKESYNLLKEKGKELDINFVGNVEGRDAFSGNLDILVADGYTGNVFLKTVEGVGKLVKRTLT